MSKPADKKRKVEQNGSSFAANVKRTCLKTLHLRRAHRCDNVSEWLSDPNNVYVGRQQRVFIHTRRPPQANELLDNPGSYLDNKGCLVLRYVIPESPFCNPFAVDRDAAKKGRRLEHRRVVDLFRERVSERIDENDALFLQQLASLRDKTLGCWCPLDMPCHADVLIEFVNRTSLK